MPQLHGINRIAYPTRCLLESADYPTTSDKWPINMSTQPMTPGFDVARLIQRFGGRAQLHRRLVARGFSVSVKMVEKWRERGNIPPTWLAEMLTIAQEEGRPIDLAEYRSGAPAPAVPTVSSLLD